MINRLYDLVMWLNEELGQLNRQKPEHGNAMRQGVLAGLELGAAWMNGDVWDKAKTAEVLKALTQDKSVSLMDILSEADKKMPEGHLFSPVMFIRSDYRRSESGRFYIRGVEMGFAYVMDLREAFAKRCSPVSTVLNTIEYLKLVRTGICTIS